MPLLGFSNGGNKNKKRRKEEKKNMQNSGLRLSDTVCTAPLGPIVQIGSNNSTLTHKQTPLSVVKLQSFVLEHTQSASNYDLKANDLQLTPAQKDQWLNSKYGTSIQSKFSISFLQSRHWLSIVLYQPQKEYPMAMELPMIRMDMQK